MQNRQPSLFSRDDTFLGVCEALGEDFRFNPLWLRLTLALLLFLSPVAVIAGYLGAGLMVLISRWAYPARRTSEARAVEPAPLLESDNDEQPVITAVAA